jgi:hypothetical protein
LQVRLGSGKASVSLRARVCWIDEQAGRYRTGIQFAAGQEAALMALIEGAGTRT